MREIKDTCKKNGREYPLVHYGKGLVSLTQAIVSNDKTLPSQYNRCRGRIDARNRQKWKSAVAAADRYVCISEIDVQVLRAGHGGIVKERGHYGKKDLGFYSEQI